MEGPCACKSYAFLPTFYVQNNRNIMKEGPLFLRPMLIEEEKQAQQMEIYQYDLVVKKLCLQNFHIENYYTDILFYLV